MNREEAIKEAIELIGNPHHMLMCINNIARSTNHPGDLVHFLETVDICSGYAQKYCVIKDNLVFISHERKYMSIRVTGKGHFYTESAKDMNRQFNLLKSDGVIHEIWNCVDEWEKPHYKGLKPLVVAKLAEVLLEVHAFRDDLAKRELESDSHLISELTQTVPEDVLQAMSVLCSK